MRLRRSRAGEEAALGAAAYDAFRLNDVSGDPMWMIDLSGAQARLLFIPPAVAADEEVEQ